MATKPTQLRIDQTLKKESNALFSELGMDMSFAVDMFLRQCILRGGLPFPVEYNKETMAEAKSISHDPNVPSYSNMEDLLKVLGG